MGDTKERAGGVELGRTDVGRGMGGREGYLLSLRAVERGIRGGYVLEILSVSSQVALPQLWLELDYSQKSPLPQTFIPEMMLCTEGTL